MKTIENKAMAGLTAACMVSLLAFTGCGASEAEQADEARMQQLRDALASAPAEVKRTEEEWLAMDMAENSDAMPEERSSAVLMAQEQAEEMMAELADYRLHLMQLQGADDYDQRAEAIHTSFNSDDSLGVDDDPAMEAARAQAWSQASQASKELSRPRKAAARALASSAPPLPSTVSRYRWAVPASMRSSPNTLAKSFEITRDHM